MSRLISMLRIFTQIGCWSLFEISPPEKLTVAFQMKSSDPPGIGIRTMFRIRHFRGSYLDSPRSLLTQLIDKFSAYRMGPAFFFAGLVTLMYVWIKELLGRAAGLAAALALILTPNLFGYAHIAVTDLPLACLWFLFAYCFWKGLFRWQWSIVLAIVWGLALATKFPAVLMPIPMILWAHIYHRQRYSNNVFVLLFLAPVFMVASQPYLWHQTGPRILEFLYEGISRAYRPDANFMIYFYHQLLFTHQLPWYYSFFVVGVTTPEPLLVLSMLGGISCAWMTKQRSEIMLFVINGTFVLMLGLMPGAVLHDGVRQMLSALPFLAALAGVGFCALVTGVFKLAQRRSKLKHFAHLKNHNSRHGVLANIRSASARRGEISPIRVKLL